MKRFYEFYYNTDLSVFKSYLPIQLDASCNGFQHLSLLSEEVELFEQLNLSESNKDSDPKDFYAFMLDKIQSYMLNIVLNKKNLSLIETERVNRLTKLNMTRNHIKKLIMTKPYNATDYRLVTNIIELMYFKGVAIFNTKTQEFILNPSEEEIKRLNENDGSGDCSTLKGMYHEDSIENIKVDDLIKRKSTINKNTSDKEIKLVNLYSTDEKSEYYVTREDLCYFIDIFNIVLFKSYPHIKSLIVYLKEMASILNKLNMPIIWRLPTGLVVSQRYVLLKIKKIEPYYYSDRTLNLTMTDKTSINTFKQKNALMPNLVHSLDSTTLFMVFNILNYYDNNMNFYSVHDCFGVSAKDVDFLINKLKGVYIDLYSNNKYIESFDADIVDALKKVLGTKHPGSEIKYNTKKRLIYTDNIDLIQLPNIPNNKDVLDDDKIKYFNKLNKSLLLIK
jgi:DNA-directed RNA polymerase